MNQFISYGFFLGSLALGLTPALSFSATAQHAASTSHTVKKAPFKNISLLFVLQAVDGEVAKTTTGYKITLQHIRPKILYFSDRPVRKAGSLSTAKFFDLWINSKIGFKKDAPNAAILSDMRDTNKNGFAHAVIATLKNPVLNNDDSMSFDIKSLSHNLVVGHHTNVSIFFDNVNDQDGCPYSCMQTFMSMGDAYG